MAFPLDHTWPRFLDFYAERMFNELPYDVFVMEWEDTTRQGDYSALRHVPAVDLTKRVALDERRNRG